MIPNIYLENGFTKHPFKTGGLRLEVRMQDSKFPSPDVAPSSHKYSDEAPLLMAEIKRVTGYPDLRLKWSYGPIPYL